MSLSFIISVYTGKHLYDKNLNNVIYENNYTKSQVSVMFCSVTYGYPLCKIFVMYPYGRLNILIYELYMYIVIEDHYKWPYMLYVFPLSYKLSTGVSFV